MLDVYVSVSDVTGLSGLQRAPEWPYLLIFSTPGWSVTESTFEDNTNTVFGMANLLTTQDLVHFGA